MNENIKLARAACLFVRLYAESEGLTGALNNEVALCAAAAFIKTVSSFEAEAMLKNSPTDMDLTFLVEEFVRSQPVYNSLDDSFPTVTAHFIAESFHKILWSLIDDDHSNS